MPGGCGRLPTCRSWRGSRLAFLCLARAAVLGRARRDLDRDALADGQQPRGPDRDPGRRAEHDDAVDGDFVSALVAVFAVGYMAGDEGYPRFFALIGLFVFSMTGLVLSNNYLLTYVFWEGVGVCSYLLIGFWHSRPSAAAAAMKAFLVNRIGDFGFAIAIFWLWSVVPGHDLSYGNVFGGARSKSMPPRRDRRDRAVVVLGGDGQERQIPLYVWLPDAMEGPTPVSALIHAATMVTAGVYLIARSMPLIALAPGGTAA